MSNPYFRFKQFTVYHDLCAMKVGIDGVLLGAWAEADSAKRVLDIGTGSGLIALMIAQRSPQAEITAIDIDKGAVSQARINAKNSPWKDRIHVYHASLQEYAQREEKFDLIVSNPPYFLNSLKAPDEKRSSARHADTLTHKELVLLSKEMLSAEGRLCIILPVEEGRECMKFAEQNGLFCTKTVNIHPKPNVDVKRLLLEFSLHYEPKTEWALTIETENRHQYSPDFTELAKDFYLKM